MHRHSQMRACGYGNLYSLWVHAFTPNIKPACLTFRTHAALFNKTWNGEAATFFPFRGTGFTTRCTRPLQIAMEGPRLDQIRSTELRLTICWLLRGQQGRVCVNAGVSCCLPRQEMGCVRGGQLIFSRGSGQDARHSNTKLGKFLPRTIMELHPRNHRANTSVCVVSREFGSDARR